MKNAMKLWLFAMLVSCGKSAGAERFDKLAKRANPVIIAMRQPASVVLDPKQPDNKVLRKACLDAIAASAPLPAFRDSADASRTGDAGPFGVDDVLLSFSMQKDSMCREDEGDGSRDARCRKWCVEMFSYMADAIGRAHDAAAKENVHLEQLRN